MKPELAYLLGYFYADGCCHVVSKILKSGTLANYPCITLEIVRSDSKHIKECLDICNIKYTAWTRFRKNSKNEQMAFRISATCNYHKLFANVMQNKQDMSFAISQIPPELHYQFIKGFFDGDGCISLSKNDKGRIYFYGSYDQNWDILTNILKILNIQFTFQKLERKVGKHRSSHIVISNKEGICKLFSFLYKEKNFDFGLLRKFLKLERVELSNNYRSHTYIPKLQNAEIVKIYS